MIIAVAIGSIALAILFYLALGRPENHTSNRAASFLHRQHGWVILGLFGIVALTYCVLVVSTTNDRIERTNKEIAQINEQVNTLPWERYRRLHYNLLFDRYSGSLREDWSEVLTTIGVDGNVSQAEFRIIATKMRFDVRSPMVGCKNKLYLNSVFQYECNNRQFVVPDNLVVERQLSSRLTSFTPY